MKSGIMIVICGVMILPVSGENPLDVQRGGVVSSFESEHLSKVQCDNMNYQVGRELSWNSVDASLAENTAAAGDPVDVSEASTGEETPAWVTELQQKGVTYQDEKKRKAANNTTRLSDYSATEVHIAEGMGLNPWDINRKQLRRWGREADITLRQ